MARPSKQTVDYFPHIIKQGKTMTILENKFGNDGYAFWFKLLEILGSTNGHVYEYKNTTDIEFLLAKTKVNKETADNILKLLADLDAIDNDLWQKKIIWSDNFIDNIRDVYTRRKVNVPQKPISKKVSDNINPTDKEKCSNDDNTNPQSKVKETKVKESIKPGELDLIQKENGQYVYPDKFEEVWELYPRKVQKKAGWRKWKATRNKNVSNDDLIAATKNYAEFCEKKGREGDYILYARTFFGPDEHWRDYLEVEEKTEREVIEEMMGVEF